MAHPADPHFDDRLLASAVRFMIDGQEEDSASVLLSCQFDTQHDTYETEYRSKYGTWWNIRRFDIVIDCPRSAYDILNNGDNPLGDAVYSALRAVAPLDPPLNKIILRGEFIEIDPSWRSELLEIARGKGVHNQLADEVQARVRTWKNLRFRSQSEVRIAATLDKAGVFFLPNCLGRLNTPNGRENREPDFLICQEGKWGILEVDGEPFHPPSRTVQDHERDRLFKSHGVRVVEHFDASECFENSDGVVKKFLNILKGS